MNWRRKSGRLWTVNDSLEPSLGEDFPSGAPFLDGLDNEFLQIDRVAQFSLRAQFDGLKELGQTPNMERGCAGLVFTTAVGETSGPCEAGLLWAIKIIVAANTQITVTRPPTNQRTFVAYVWAGFSAPKRVAMTY